MHPPIVHFVVALPIVVLLLEFINVFTKKRTIGVISFLLLILVSITAIVAYLTGTVDGKEAYPLLSEVAQSELKEHKLLGTYLMLSSVLVLVFKLLSSLISRGLMKALYILILVLFIAGILKQGKEGGKLVYTYGVNVEKVLELDNELDDVKEELEELEEANKPELVPVDETSSIENTGVEVIKNQNNTPKIEAVKVPVTEKIEEKAEVEVIPQVAVTPTVATH
jgi:uncharacterized membrane protein